MADQTDRNGSDPIAKIDNQNQLDALRRDITRLQTDHVEHVRRIDRIFAGTNERLVIPKMLQALDDMASWRGSYVDRNARRHALDSLECVLDEAKKIIADLRPVPTDPPKD